ncbi:MAG TPA: methylmalonyl Co-A mutase-associated GTPase MeaB [Actinomycetota bacterium]|jgi:LAO/AO transport system kinase|nr:methylmalonyl Co-A mutase-associated GTPase MeaB [Actinomycetota bacterium]
MDPDDLVGRAVRGERRAIARLISLVEDGGPQLGDVMRALFPHTGSAYSIGITGAPGAGKSTLTERVVARARRDDHAVGVLAVDPSSPFSGGALLGDRVRMQSHATDPDVFIRSMATRGHLGGIALATPEALRVLDAAGMSIVIIETVGVGQSEVEITDACDTTIVVLNPGWGDAVQAGKAGLMEIADVFVVNKADRAGTKETVREIRQMLQMSDAEWKPEIVTTVAVKDEGTDELWAAVEKHRAYQEERGLLEERRRRRVAREIREIVAERYRRRIDAEMSGLLADLVHDVHERRTDPYAAADRIVAALAAR